MSIDKTNSVFLLGGKDLEMVTIKEVLKEAGFEEGKSLFDKSLSWDNAKLSAYNDIMGANKNKHIYAVELEEDVDLPPKYTRIDHHNDYAGRKASLLQVLKLIGAKPTRERRLIAANDSLYIEGMKCLGATDEEIRAIRERDRKVQGITAQDENAAKNDVRSRKVVGEIVIICATTPYFSAITDALYFDIPAKERKNKCIVYDDSKIVFYGFPIEALKQYLERERVSSNSIYFGGGTQGFVGVKSNVLSKDSIKALKDKCVERFQSLYSYHAFMFPFCFDKGDFSKSLAQRITIDDMFNDTLAKAGWRYQKFDLSSFGNTHIYNEYVYFTEPIRETLYNFKEFREGETSYYYVKKTGEDSRYIISLIDGKRFELHLTDVYLRLFETGIGILVFEMENYLYGDFEDILKINEYGRRVYPQFLDNKCPNYATGTKNAFLADTIEVHLSSSEYCKEEFKDSYEGAIPNDIVIGNHIMGVLGKDVFTQKGGESFCTIKPILDDRMFVVSYAENEKLMGELQKPYGHFSRNDKWYRYLFVDGNDKTVQYMPMQETLAKTSTYPRWLDYGTLWGVTRYSFVVLTTPSGRDLVLPHAQYHYHQMSVLILATQASLARFRDEVSRLSNFDNDEHIEEKVRVLYEYYIKFINKLHFRDVTSQDQGMELYDIAKKQLAFDKEIKDLDGEIAELHTYVSMLNQIKEAREAEKREQRLEAISKLGAIFLPPSLLAGIFGMNVFAFKESVKSVTIAIVAMVASAIVGYMAIEKMHFFKSFKSRLIGALAIALAVWGIVVSMGEAKEPPSVTKKRNTTFFEAAANKHDIVPTTKGGER